MVTVKANVVKHGVTGSYTRANGFTATVTYIVSDLTGGNDESLVLDALSVAGVPDLGSSMPDPNFNALTVTSLTSEAKGSGSTFKVVAVYSQPSATQIPPTDIKLAANATLTVGTTLVEVETSFDRFANEIITEHKAGKEVRGSVRYFSPSTTITYMRRELGSPGNFASNFIGGVNNAIAFGDPVGTWLITNISGTTTDGGVEYLVTYEFQRSPKIGKNLDGTGEDWNVQPWDPLIVEIDPDTGDFVKGAEINKGMKIVKLYRPVTFLDLKLALAGPTTP